MTIPSNYKDLGINWVRRTPTQYEAFVSAVIIAAQNNTGEIRLLYEDQTEEFALCPEINLCDPELPFFSIVSAVQSKRVE